MKKPVLIYGAGGHAKTVIDLIRALEKWEIAGIVDDRVPRGTAVMDVPVLGGAEVLPDCHRRGITAAVNAVGGIGNYAVRWRIFEKLKASNFTFPTLIHPAALVEPSVQLDEGVQILAMTYVSSESRIGFGSLINAGAVLSHECLLGKCVNLSPGALLAGNVQINDFAQIGMGATLNLGVKIGREARVGNSAVVKSDVPDGGRVYAGTVWPYIRPDHKPEDKTYRKIA